jgi:poly(3-hydroxybutyrate) depolymerase/kynurenine formamidase
MPSRPARTRFCWSPAIRLDWRPRRAVSCLLLASAALALAKDRASAQEPGTVVAADRRVQAMHYRFEATGVDVPYALFVPSGYDPSRAWPLIVALHGLGRPYDWMMGYEGFIDMAERDGYVVVSPLGYHPRGWYGSRGYGIPPGAAREGERLPENLGALSEQDVMNVLAIARERFRIDSDRIYLWGHSMGGAGAYHLAAKFPDVWAAVAVAAPAPLPDRIDDLQRMRQIPVLVLHGDADATVPVEQSRRWVARMRELGMQHVYVEIPGGDHSAFVSRNPETLSKVFSFFDLTHKGTRGAQVRTQVTRETIERWARELSNQGRWGANDEFGTLNLVTPEHRVRAARLVTRGLSVSLSHDYIKERAADATSPWGHELLGSPRAGFLSDRYTIAYHGFAHSHMDALCHNSVGGLMYNGIPRTTVDSVAGCTRLGITVAKDGVVTRGILMDIARLNGVEYLEPGTPIYVEDLEAWERHAGVRVSPGDVVLVRAGRWARRAKEGPWATGQLAAGLHASVAPWLRERGVAMLGSDYTNDVLPSGVEGVAMPIHQLTLVSMGMWLFDNLDLERLAEVAAEQGRWEFMLVAAPLAVPGGTGAPLNPVAIF